MPKSEDFRPGARVRTKCSPPRIGIVVSGGKELDEPPPDSVYVVFDDLPNQVICCRKDVLVLVEEL
jgi:hypothetical protein